MMETVATQGREIKAVDRWTVSGRSLIIREMALVPLQLPETAAAPCLLERIHFVIGAEGLRSGVAKPGRIFFFFSAWQHLSELSGRCSGGRRSVVSPPPLAGLPSDAPGCLAARRIAWVSGGRGELLFCSTSAVS